MSQQACVSPFADALRRARLHRSLTIDDVARETLLSDKQIIGLENDDLSYFYTLGYAERAARSYAAFLDVDTALEGAPPYVPLSPEAPAEPSVDIAAGMKRSRAASRAPLIGFAIICVGLFGYAARTLWFSSTAASPIAVEQPSIAQASMSEQASTREQALSPALADALPDDVPSGDVEWFPDPPRAPVPAPAPLPDPGEKTHRFFVVVARATAITAIDGRGVTLLAGTQTPTSGKRVLGVPPFKITVADPDAVEVYYLGNRIRPDRSPIDGISVSQGQP